MSDCSIARRFVLYHPYLMFGFGYSTIPKGRESDRATSADAVASTDFFGWLNQSHTNYNNQYQIPPEIGYQLAN